MNHFRKLTYRILVFFFIVGWSFPVQAQVPPSSSEMSRYEGLLAAVAQGDIKRIKALIEKGREVDIRDRYGRTPLHVAAYTGQHEAMHALVNSGADPNAMENDRYDIVTIAAVANDVSTLGVALSLGASAKNTTSPYDGTALIAAAHLGHVEVVQILIEAGAPLDHINNLGWTALIESIVLGNGGLRHILVLKSLVKAGADINLTDRSGQTPLMLADVRGYTEMVSVLQQF